MLGVERLMNLFPSLFLVLVLLISACTAKESINSKKIVAEPTYELSALRFVEVDMEKLNLEVDLKIINPNYLALEFNNVNYQLNIDSRRVLSGTLSESIMVPARGDITVSIPLSVDVNKLASGALNLMMNRRVKYQLNTNLVSQVPILEKTSFQIQKAGELTF